MSNKSVFPSEDCISKKEATMGRLCVHLVCVTNVCISGEEYQTLVCSCEEDLCATCIPEFHNPANLFEGEQ